MRIYFLSSCGAALKLNGLFLGFIGSFEKFVDVTLSERILVEILPESSAFYPLSFVLDEKFLEKPAEFCDVYTFDGGAIIEITAFPACANELKVIKQERLGDTLLTLYNDGKTCLSLENGKDFALETLPYGFESCEFSEHFLKGERFISACFEKDVGKLLLVFTDAYKKVFANNVVDFSFDGALLTKICYADPARHVAETRWEWQEKFVMTNYSVKASRDFPSDNIPKELLPFLFFNEVLVCGEPEKYLCESLKSRSGEFKEYLGEFAGVCQPPEIFSLLHPDKTAAGLVYPKGKNKFEIKFFGVDLEDCKITNVFPIE